MILAAGRGERMRPLTDTLPKPLLAVGNKPLIVWHIERLAQAGIRRIVINHAWLGHKFPEILGDGSQFGVEIHYSPEGPGGLETAGGIANALPLLGNKPFLVINGDIWCDWNPIETQAHINQLEQHQKSAWLLLVNNPDHHIEGDFYLDTAGIVSSDLEKTGKSNANMPVKLTFAGIGIYQPQLFADIGKQTFAKLAPLLRREMQAQQVLGAHYTGQWTDVGTPERLALLDQQLRHHPQN
nr:nucleotidyltransferase family protein [Pelistega europaea]